MATDLEPAGPREDEGRRLRAELEQAQGAVAQLRRQLAEPVDAARVAREAEARTAPLRVELDALAGQIATLEARQTELAAQERELSDVRARLQSPSAAAEPLLLVVSVALGLLAGLLVLWSFDWTSRDPTQVAFLTAICAVPLVVLVGQAWKAGRASAASRRK